MNQKRDGQGYTAAATEKKKGGGGTEISTAVPAPGVQGWAAQGTLVGTTKMASPLLPQAPLTEKKKLRKTGKKHGMDKDFTFELSWGRPGLTTWNETSDCSGVS